MCVREYNGDVAGSNYAPSTSFKTPDNASKLPYRYAEAIIYVMYPYGGFHQFNYVRLGYNEKSISC